MGAAAQYPANGTNEEKYRYVYEKAKEYGDKFPEITASQFAYETGYGKSPKGTNNVFNQTAVGDTLKKRKFENYKTIDDGIKARVNKWSKKYATATNAVSALAMIQPSFAPNADKNENYIANVMKIAKQYKLYKGSTDLPNADVKPQFYQEGRAMNDAGWYSYTQKAVDKHWKDYNDEMKKLDEKAKSGEPEEFINMDRIALQKKYQDMGLRGQFNNEIRKENKINEKKEKEKNTKTYEGVRMMTEFLSDGDLLMEGTASGQFEHKDKIVLEIAGDKKKELEGILKYNPEYKKYFKQKGNVKDFGYLDTRKPYVLEIPKKDDGKNIFTELKKNADYINPGGKFEVYDKNGVMKEDQWNSWWAGTGVLRTGLITDTKFDVPGTSYTRPLTTNQRQLLEHIPETVTETPVEETVVDPTTATEEDVAKKKEEETAKKEAAKKAETVAAAEKAIEDNGSAFFKDDMKAPAQYQEEDFKDPFPFAEILSGAMGVAMGADMANKKIPERTEQVSDAFRNYTAELSKLSQIGLRPEDEAYAKRMLTESYQHSITTLENQANGNRNIILGNLGRVDLQTQQGMLEIALADSKAKTDAMYKYGEAVKYINDFDANRDIANSERKYQDVLMTKEAGGKLMGSAFASILENFQNYKDNAPGSINHAFKSKFYRDSFGIDPSLKDNGKGDTEFTPSYEKLKRAKLNEEAKKFNDTKESYWGLNPEKRKIANNFFNQNQNTNDFYGMIDYLKKTDNPGVLNLDKSEEALRNNDYSQMFGPKDVAKIDTATATIASKDGEIKTETPIDEAAKKITSVSDSKPAGTVSPVTNAEILGNSGGIQIASNNSQVQKTEADLTYERMHKANSDLEAYLAKSKGNDILDNITEKAKQDTISMQQQMVGI